jgi:hypothetical protein
MPVRVTHLTISYSTYTSQPHLPLSWMDGWMTLTMGSVYIGFVFGVLQLARLEHNLAFSAAAGGY